MNDSVCITVLPLTATTVCCTAKGVTPEWEPQSNDRAPHTRRRVAHRCLGGRASCSGPCSFWDPCCPSFHSPLTGRGEGRWSIHAALLPIPTFPQYCSAQILPERICRSSPPFRKGGQGGILGRWGRAKAEQIPPSPPFIKGGTGGCAQARLIRKKSAEQY
jgi:hypothetical protein